MPDRSRRRPRDPNELAKLVVDIATEQREHPEFTAKERAKNPAAVALGRLGGAKGGKARAKRLSAKRRREIAQVAAAARWKTNDG